MGSTKFSSLFCAFVLATLVSSCASKKDSLKAKQAELYYGAGTQSLIEGEYTDALKNLVQANKIDPENPDILTNLGMAYYFKGERDLAIKILNQVLSMDKNNSDAKTNLASIHYNDKNYARAEKLYKEVLKDLTYDKQARTLYNLGKLNVEVYKNMMTAESYFKQSIKEDDNYCPSYHELGLINYQRRQFNAAYKNFKEAGMGSCFSYAAPHFYQALTLIQLRRFDDARQKLIEVQSRFSKTAFAAHARIKLNELNASKDETPTETHATRTVLESPEF